MRLSRQTSFIVRTLVYCTVSESDRVGDIARAFGISDMFPFKVIMSLTHNGVLETVLSRRGGIRLARPTCAINLLEVIKLTEDGFALSKCCTHESDACPIRNR